MADNRGKASAHPGNSRPSQKPPTADFKQYFKNAFLARNRNGNCFSQSFFAEALQPASATADRNGRL
jgi:hypothetical protein